MALLGLHISVSAKLVLVNNVNSWPSQGITFGKQTLCQADTPLNKNYDILGFQLTAYLGRPGPFQHDCLLATSPTAGLHPGHPYIRCLV